MKQAIEYVKQHKKIIAVALLLIVCICIAILLYGTSSKTTTISASTVERTPNETKLMRILSEIDGVGQAEVMITEGEGEIKGIIIVCEGASNLSTKSNVLNAVTTVFNVKKSNIAIYAMK